MEFIKELNGEVAEIRVEGKDLPNFEMAVMGDFKLADVNAERPVYEYFRRFSREAFLDFPGLAMKGASQFSFFDTTKRRKRICGVKFKNPGGANLVQYQVVAPVIKQKVRKVG